MGNSQKSFARHSFNKCSGCQGRIRVNLTPKMRQSLLNVTPRSQMMPNFALPLHKYDSKKRLNWQQVLLRLPPTLVKVNDLTPLRQEFSNSAPKIFGVEHTDSTLVRMQVWRVKYVENSLSFKRL